MSENAGTDDAAVNPFMTVVNKRLRMVKKKWQKIEALESKDPIELNHEQAVLLQSKPIQKILLDELTQIITAFEQEVPPPEIASKKNKDNKPAPVPEKVDNACQTDPESCPEPVAGKQQESDVIEERKHIPSQSSRPEAVPPINTEHIIGLFKAFAVVSHSYLYLRLCCSLDYESPDPVSAADLKELLHLAYFVLELPIPDASIILRQEKTGAEHLALFLSESPTHPAMLGIDGETFMPMTNSYAQLAKVLERVSQAMKSDQLLQTHVLSGFGVKTNANGTNTSQVEDANSAVSAMQHDAGLLRGVNGAPAPQNQADQHNRLPEGAEGQMNGENGGDSAGMNGDGSIGSRQRGPRRGGGRPPLEQGNRKAGTSGGEGGPGGRGIPIGGGRGQAKPRAGP